MVSSLGAQKNLGPGTVVVQPREKVPRHWIFDHEMMMGVGATVLLRRQRSPWGVMWDQNAAAVEAVAPRQCGAPQAPPSRPDGGTDGMVVRSRIPEKMGLLHSLELVPDHGALVQARPP